MVKKILVLFASLNLFSNLLTADPYIDLRAGYFRFLDSTLNDMYNKGGIDVQLCGAYPVYEQLQVYGAVEYFHRSGHPLDSDASTHVNGIPFSAGLQWMHDFYQSAKVYLSIGPRLSLLYFNDNTTYETPTFSTTNFGGFGNLGFLVDIGANFCIDIFGEYSYLTANFPKKVVSDHDSKPQVGGYCLGGGIAYKF